MAYDFHYTPTGTGVISGKEVLEQTEDAINDLGNTAISGVQEALDKAEQALTNSENAVDDAQTALNTANNAEGVAIQAQTDVGNLSGTVTNIGNRVTTAEGNITNLQGRMTTAEGNITNLQGRMTTAESDIGNLQTAVSTAQATANSAQQTATTARQQSYVFRYSGTAVVPNSTIAYSTIDNTDNIKSGDKILDVDGKLFEITAVDTANQTVTVGSALIDLALDANVVHTSGNETVGGQKTFSESIICFSNSDAKSIICKTPLSTYDSANTVGDNTKLRFLDKNNNSISYIMQRKLTNGSTDISLNVSNTDSNNQPIEATLTFVLDSANEPRFSPGIDNTISIGRPTFRYKSFYGMNYYYGANNVEFSTKFVTSDTAQTILGNKTFSSNVNVYNSDSNATTPNLYLRSSKIEISSQGNTSGDQNLTYLDKNNTLYANVKGAVQSNGSAVKIRATAKDSSNNSVINELQMLAYTNGTKAIFPSYSNEIDLGTSSYKWKSFNGVEPSALSLPSDRSARIDISSYITNLGNGDNNQYIVPANGYIWLHFTSINSALCYSQTSGGLTNYAQTFSRYQGDGQLYAFFPVRKDDKFVVQIYTSSTAVVQNAYFIPCQGNI